MPSEPVWLTPDEVIRINQRMLDPDEPHVLRDPDGLYGACARARNLWAYDDVEDIITLACAVLFSIAGAQVFVQTNKRTGFTAALTFLRNNGYEFSAPDYAAFANFIKEVCQHTATVEDFEDIFSDYVYEP